MNNSPLRLFRLPLEISSWGVFFLSFCLYWLTTDASVSYWDCAEYVTSASRLEIGHPPGNPIWMLAMRIATIPFPPLLHAYVINLCSGVCMAFATFFLCRIIFITGILFIYPNIRKIAGKRIAIGMSAISSAGASLCFGLCDSAWFSAVEAEVYAMSAMLTGASLWIMVRWWFENSSAGRSRCLILIAYLLGLSLGVHQLNLLCIPVFALIILYKKYPKPINPLIVTATLLISVGIIALLLMVFIPGILYLAEIFELYFVNKLNTPFNIGLIIFTIFIFFLLIICIYLLSRKRLQYIANAFWMITFILVGFSSFGIILIRASANPFMNEGKPSDIFSLKAYIQREQYPSTPLLYGQTPYSQPLLEETYVDGKPQYTKYILEKGKPLYVKSIPNAILSPRSGFLSTQDSIENMRIIGRETGGYLLSDYSFTQTLTPELNMWFPRITSRNHNDREAYSDWAGMTEKTMVRLPISETIDSTGSFTSRLDSTGERRYVYSYRPTYTQNIRYFLSYQAFYMYFRYLFWNFMGRQNDYPSTGEIDHGNFITGFDVIDNLMVGPSEAIPDELWKDNPGHNNYYTLPFLIGLLGIITLAACSFKSRRFLSVSGCLFIMTGLAIVVYLNQGPGEPRERDYTFLGSYMAFVMWIAAGISLLIYLSFRYIPKKVAFIISTIISIFPASLMGVENFDDHDRKGRYEPTFFASALLDYESPAIIFSHGDNSTFPLWYASEVLAMGVNHVPVDVSYLSVPSYITGLQKQAHKKLQTIVDPAQIAYGAFLLTKIPPDSLSDPMSLPAALNKLYDSSLQPAIWPSSKVKIPSFQGDTVTINLHDFTGGSSYLSFRHLMLLDLIASQMESDNPFILFFPYLIDWRLYKPLNPVLQESLFGKIYNPRPNIINADSLFKEGVKRELIKLNKLDIKPHYADPLIADRTRRYRGELIIAGMSLIEKNELELTTEIIKTIEKKFPYDNISPGSFTMEDSTFMEGKEYLKLLTLLNELTGNQYFQEKANIQKSLLEQRRNQWLNYYRRLSPSQREKLSNRSRRELINH